MINVDLFLVANGDFAGSSFRNGRRTYLPAPCPDTSNINLWNILRNNIGKDLSKVSMPVELNEPLNTLQRMCEELEYSELLDKAAETEDPFERMVKKLESCTSEQIGISAGLHNPLPRPLYRKQPKKPAFLISSILDPCLLLCPSVIASCLNSR